MKSILLKSLLVVIVCLPGLGLAPVAWAATVFSYQGQLDQNGQPYTGTVNLAFELYSAPVAGTQIGATVSLPNHPVQNGLFQAELDFGPVFDGSPRYLSVSVNGSGLSPRQAVHAAPLALFALAGNEGPEGPVGPAGPPGSQGPPGAPGDSHWQLSGADTYYDAGKVGIGVSNPATPLQVAGSTVFGAAGNSAHPNPAANSIVAGGTETFPNTATGLFEAVVGGEGNVASGSRNFVGGGHFNIASNENNFVGGGYGNEVSGHHSFVAAGADNSISGSYSFVGAGSNNEVSGAASFAAGFFAKALHHGSFVWADWQPGIYGFATTADNQFLVRASGGVGFGIAPVDHFEIAAQVSNPGNPDFGNGALRVTIDGGTRLRLLGNGGLAIGNSYNSSGVPDRGLRVHGQVRLDDLATGGGTELCLNGDGRISSCTSSSRRYKDEVTDLENAGALVGRLRAVSFRWLESGRSDIGLIAEEVAEIEPRLATYDGDGAIDGVNYRHLTAVLVAALQEQQSDLAARDRQVLDLRQELDRQGRLLAELQAAMEELK